MTLVPGISHQRQVTGVITVTLPARFSVEERILKLIDEREIELAPYEIARKVHAKRTTVQVILRKLLDRGLILQPYPGAYCNKITYGMRFVPLYTHNIRLRFLTGTISHWEKVEKATFHSMFLRMLHGLIF